jgi:BASS family bile acid:Na+ symporter
MRFAPIIALAAQVSLALTVLDIGLRALPGDATWLLRRPPLLVRSMLSMNVIMPLFALAIAYAFDLRPPVKIALFALAVSPVPPVLPKKAIKAGGSSSYAIGLLVVASVVAIVFVPLVVWIVAKVVDVPARLVPAVIAGVVGKVIFLPLLVALLIRRSAPRAAERIAKPLGMVSAGLLAVAVIAILIAAFPAMKSLIGDGALLAIMIVTAVGLAVGHLIGGPATSDRTVLALATASRHPAIAIAVGYALFPDQSLVPAAVLLSLVVVTFVSVPYTWWVDRAAQGQLLATLGLLDRRRSSPGAYVGAERRAGPTRGHDRR